MSILFFFSSRRRHTRSLRDWSSDVCSSDLVRLVVARSPCCIVRHLLVASQPVLEQAQVPALRVTTVLDSPAQEEVRSEERRVGKECRSGWRACQYEKEKILGQHE